MAEEVLHDDSYRLTRKQLKDYKEYNRDEKRVRAFVNTPVLYDIYLSMLDNDKLQFGFLKNQRRIRKEKHDDLRDFEKQHEHELTSEKETDSIINRSKYALEDGDRQEEIK